MAWWDRMPPGQVEKLLGAYLLTAVRAATAGRAQQPSGVHNSALRPIARATHCQARACRRGPRAAYAQVQGVHERARAAGRAQRHAVQLQQRRARAARHAVERHVLQPDARRRGRRPCAQRDKDDLG